MAVHLKKKSVFFVILLLFAFNPVCSRAAYKTPPGPIVKVIDAPIPPQACLSPDGRFMALVDQKLYPSVSMLSRPYAPLAGLKIDQSRSSLWRQTLITGIGILEIGTGNSRSVELPPAANIDVPQWNSDSSMLAFTGDDDKGLSLFTAKAGEGKVHCYKGIRLNNILGPPFSWQGDNLHLLVRLVENGKSMPSRSIEAYGPSVEETSGKMAKLMTFQNLLKNPYDEALFEYYGRTQLALLDASTGMIARIGSPGLYLDAEASPDGRYFVVTRLTRPFSYRVPFARFARSLEIWDKDGKVIRLIAHLPVQEEIPPDGVPTGPRDLVWQVGYDASLLWVEALDGGDPLVKTACRDRLMSLEAPFSGEPRLLRTMANRFSGLKFLKARGMILLTDFDRARQWTTTSLADLARGDRPPEILFERNIKDDYLNPGAPVLETDGRGQRFVKEEGGAIFLAGKGASEEGERPFLSRFTLATKAKTILFHSRAGFYEYFEGFYGGKPDRIIIRSESVTVPPNHFLCDLGNNTRKELTFYKDPVPELRAYTKELVKYRRADGVELSGTLYLPAGASRGSRLPLVIWAYPLEYSDSSVAGQVRGSPSRFSFFTGPSPLFFLMEGYAVLYNAAMPVVGDPETKNDTFIEQTVSSAKAAIDYLDSRGLIDPRRVIVGGHSYGAFMTANLLAHSRLFAAGIARSGAYNRSLTPFGFQNERRSFWDAPDVYVKISPFTYAQQIKDPLLLIHGECDDNPGTFPIQSERLFEAIKGNGGTARLVILPCESHGYAARESVLHTIAEMFEWGDRFVKGRR
jgi:dipeptidyl aminopeptidase/acylaminoacyl peptidase